MTTQRIVHVINNLYLGGAEMMLVRLLGRLDPHRWDCHVLSLIGDGPAAEQLGKLGIPVTVIGMKRGLPGPLSLARLGSRLRALRPALVQTWLYHSDLLGGLATRLRLPEVPVVWNLRMNGPTRGRDKLTTCWTARACAALSHRLPARIIVNSFAGRDVHQKLGYDAGRLEVIPNGFDTEQFSPSAAARVALRQELGLPVSTPLIGMAARWDPLKDFGTVLASAATLMQQHPDLHVVLCGTGIDEENTALVGLAEAAGCGERLHLMGRRSDMPVWQAALDVALLASHTEGFPNTVGEAMACGVPCVVTDAGGSAQLLGVTGRVVPVGDRVGFSAGINELLQMSAFERQQIGVLGRQRIIENFSLERMVDRFERLWEEVLDAVPRGNQVQTRQVA